MDLRKITFYTYNEHHRRIGQQLHDANQAKSLLDSARRELPIIDALLGMIPELNQLPDEETRQHAFNCLMRDVHLMLTLRAVERGDEPSSVTASPESENDPKSDAKLQLRRFGMN